MQSWAGGVDLGRQAEDVQETGKPAARGDLRRKLGRRSTAADRDMGGDFW
jgi:hypothetical protein